MLDVLVKKERIREIEMRTPKEARKEKSLLPAANFTKVPYNEYSRVSIISTFWEQKKVDKHFML